ncbi:sensor domain-containing diguanylate cyclase [Vibrio salinus]|uniref:sensor domain-containing diguanylate cyclase n=1 Tax=Vibrio salinus TaxID=2899784 RepID=UPI001E3CA95C|nr:sensor domain-containing diguanylate cyclase [Vibrio salinus]MCE0494424.1 GGDEF domain-containing protein [Vibrio salinus]
MEQINRYYTILDALPDHIFVFTESGRYIKVFGGDENATGFDCKSFIGKLLYDVIPSELAEVFLSYILAALETDSTQKLKYKFDWQSMPDLPSNVDCPSELWFEGIVKPLGFIHGGERTVLWIAKNITQQYVLEQKLKMLSEIDELTNVLNRRSFSYSLNDAIDEYSQFGRVFSLAMFDIDKFKRINDTLGHALGDEIIRHVVNVVQEELRSCDSIGRLGGDEFAIILRDSNQDNAYKVAEKLRSVVENSICDLCHYEVQVTISLGISEVIPEDVDSRNIATRADKAMYHSKMNGCNRTSLFDESIDKLDTDISKCSWVSIKKEI